MRKIVLVCLMVLALFVPLYAGGSGESSSADGTVVLEILLSGDTTEGSPMQKAVERFNAEYADKGIQAQVNEISLSDLPTQVSNRIRAGKLPALVKNTTNTFEQFTDNFYPLDETGLDPNDFTMNYSVRGGRFVSTTLNSTSVGLFLNTTLWDEAGVPYPTTEEERWTWDEFVEALKTVMERTGCEGIAIEHSQQRMQTLLYQFGSRITPADDPYTLVFDSPETREGMEYFINLVKDGVATYTDIVGIDTAANTFKSGRVAAHIGGNWSLTDFAENITGFEWAPVLMPYAKEKATMIGGNLLSIFDGSGQEKEAIEFVKWFYQPENYKQYLADANYLSGMKSLDVDYTLEELAVFQQELAASCNTPNEDMMIQVNHPGASYGNTIRDNWTQAIVGEITVDEAIDRIINDIIIAYPDVKEAQ